MTKQKKSDNISNAPYNPLDKKNLGESVIDALLETESVPLKLTFPFLGAGIYSIYYSGTFHAYKKVSELNKNGNFNFPIYVGKAVPYGARKGGIGTGNDQGRALYNRLNDHAKSIESAINLDVNEFFCRFLVVDDIWIPLAESLLIEHFSPVWNVVIEGFGNHDPGGGRTGQQKSPWDTLHPGRIWAERLHKSKFTESELLDMIRKHLE